MKRPSTARAEGPVAFGCHPLHALPRRRGRAWKGWAGPINRAVGTSAGPGCRSRPGGCESRIGPGEGRRPVERPKPASSGEGLRTGRVSCVSLRRLRGCRQPGLLRLYRIGLSQSKPPAIEEAEIGSGSVSACAPGTESGSASTRSYQHRVAGDGVSHFYCPRPASSLVPLATFPPLFSQPWNGSAALWFFMSSSYCDHGVG